MAVGFGWRSASALRPRKFKSGASAPEVKGAGALLRPLYLRHNVGVKETLELINRMQADGVIGKYAIGGAVAATIYLEPAATFDVDVFVTLPTTKGSLLVSLGPIYEYAKARGYRIEREHIVIGDWPVQFLSADDDLLHDAVADAVEVNVEGVRTWVMPAEHLVAIALRTGRSKDHLRILQFIEQDAVDRDRLNQLLDRHGLTARWREFEAKYPGGEHGQEDR